MVIILGATGFIGKSLCSHFFQNQIPFKAISSKEIDLTKETSFKKLKTIFNPDTVVIFAASIIREHGDDLENMQKNIDMARNVGKVIETNPVKKLIFISSIDVYGNAVKKINELTPLNPINYYGISKLTSELVLKVTAIKSKTPILILRLGGIFGPGQSPNKYGPNSFIHSMFNHLPITIFGDGKELRDLVFVKDLAKIISHLSFNKLEGTINAASGRSFSFQDIVKTLKLLTGNKIRVLKKPRTGIKLDFTFDNSKLQKELPKDFKFTTLKEALKITVDALDNSH